MYLPTAHASNGTPISEIPVPLRRWLDLCLALCLPRCRLCPPRIAATAVSGSCSPLDPNAAPWFPQRPPITPRFRCRVAHGGERPGPGWTSWPPSAACVVQGGGKAAQPWFPQTRSLSALGFAPLSPPLSCQTRVAWAARAAGPSGLLRVLVLVLPDLDPRGKGLRGYARREFWFRLEGCVVGGCFWASACSFRLVCQRGASVSTDRRGLANAWTQAGRSGLWYQLP
ncbi:hypothetical protein GGTG_02602 [Gaeumannomyces tritici R3-111a-1]|uniref:Uncharacterized protein n=1 Tax=Gaeumannomyces tritici (strain R3-111a-1) TaxID=644352 RepID=J3NMU3_GAET3|nr:hypothetical protein GGTG_02602 [Gaeumannomyces tritici R3-111a-1]EJT77494.1 hypothetical protein GGTG_02602 [Gaeumannomyces tritici R3-111a-1]